MEKEHRAMNLTIGWYKTRNGSKWHVDFVTVQGWGSGHNENRDRLAMWNERGSVLFYDADWDLVERIEQQQHSPEKPKETIEDNLNVAWGKPSRYVILGLKSVCSRRYHGMPLWALVRDCSTYGSTSSADICRRAGFDPDQTLSSKPLKEIGE